MRHRFVIVIVLLGLVLSVSPAAAIISVVNPRQEPELILDEAEAEKVVGLQGTTFPVLYSAVSPDDASILTLISGPEQFELSFTNIQSGARTPVSPRALQYSPLTEIVWRDNATAAYVASDARDNILLISLNRDTGNVITSTLQLPGFPVSLSPNGSRLLVAYLSGEEIQRKSYHPSPFIHEVKQRRMTSERPGRARYDYDHDVVKLAEEGVGLASFDLYSQELIPLTVLPPGSGIASQPAWTPDGSKLAYVRWTIPNIGRSGNLLSEIVTQEALGAIPPAQNPFFTGNFVDVFDLAGHVIRPTGLKASEGNGYIYGDASWSSDGKTLLTQMYGPSTLVGRRYPTYVNPDRSLVRFYDANLQPLNTFDRPEIQTPYVTIARFVSPDEVLFNAVTGMTHRIFYYNRISGEFRQVSRWDGTYFQMEPTRLSRQLVFNYSAFQHPEELYRIGWDGNGMVALTNLNVAVAQLNQVRVDPVSFTVRSGGVRTGFLIQPATAAFPPKDVRVIVWQEGGPTSTMTNRYAANVENPYNLLGNFGFAVLIVPLQGRLGFGPQALNDLANGNNFGQIDIDEGAEIVQQMYQRGWSSPGKVGVTGCSYGGYFTSQSISRHPDLYAAANTQCSLLDLFTEWQFGFTPVVSYLEGLAPTIAPNEYTRDSPLFNAGAVKTPLLMFHGTQDFLPVQIAANFHDQVEANDVPIVLLAFQGEGHGLSSPVSQFTAGQAQIQWFREFLAP